MVTQARPKAKPKVKRVVVDKTLKRQLVAANRQLNAMKDRKAKKAQRKAENRIINSNVRGMFELCDDLSKCFIVYGEDKL